MSPWNLGIGDVSEETHVLRNKLSNKEGQIAAQQDRLVRQAAEIQELSNTLNEALHKLGNETERALKLETDVKQRSEDLQNQKIALQNAQAALSAAHSKVKDNDLETRGLQATLEAISHTSDEHKARGDRLEREKSMLDARVKELGNELQQASQHLQTTTPNRRGITNGISRPRSSSLSNFKVTTLEQDLLEARTCLATKETELRTVHEKLSQMQNDLIKVDNEKSAMEMNLRAEMGKLQSFLEEKEEEVAYLNEQQGDTGREEALLKRIDEDAAKIEALEMVLRGAEDPKQLREKLQRVEGQIWRERKHLAELEEREIQLIQEKEQALDELEEARCVIVGLEKRLRDQEIRDHSINERAIKTLKTCDDPLMMEDSCLIDIETLEPEPQLPSPLPGLMSVSEPNANVVTHIERLLAAIDRLRGERDSLRRDVQFLESETRFTIEALEAKLSASISSASDKTVTTITQLKAEMDELHSHLAKVSEQNAATIESKNCEIQRLGLAVQTLAVVLDHSSSQLQCKDFQWEKDLETARMAEQETREELEDVLHRMSEVATHLQDVESERDSLSLQITNLMTDMQNVQEELTNAESRYTSLQFHQLSNMTNSEATRNLRGQIEELENRVMRRTEQIGIHQHDIKRLETNLRLQEERLSEMTTELEMMAAQKDAMVEDCADAREARDEALMHVERLEEEVESLESRNIDNTVVNESLIVTIVQTVCQAREAIRLAREEVAEAQRTPAQQSMEIQQLQRKEAALHKSIEEYRNEIQELTTTLSQCQMEVRHASALATNLQQENLELVSQLENGALQAQNHEVTINDLQRLNQELRGSVQEQQLSLTRIRKEHATQLDRFREEHRAVKQELEQKITSLQGKSEEQARLLDISKKEVARMCDRLQEETEGRAEDKKQHTMALLSEKGRNEDAAETISQLRGEFETLERDHQRTTLHLQSLEDEKLSLQQQMTELEAEIQRSKSLSHYLEIQIKDSDQLITTLKGDIECTKADLARSEKSWKAAEVNLSLQNAQHKREMTELQRELSAFRSRPDFEQALAELEERNSEMEELLRNKCAEIEENDDRALEMLKEKKKLTTKVESLTRKVQNLQTKLVAAKASNAVQLLPESQPTVPALPLSLTSPTQQSTRPRSATVSSAPPIYPPLVETPSTSTARNTSNRLVSAPSFLPRPKTPESRTIAPVFKARTPERQIQLEAVPIPPVPVIGKKRAAPDDFEAYENLPAHAFTADGEDIENRTPRVRRVLSSLQSGFTPTRNQNIRPTLAIPSPGRGAPSRMLPLISDLTNSPHHLAPSSAKPSKRSWLGKIRGNSQATDRPLGMRSLFDRGETS